MRAIVVDDSRAIRNIVAQMLQELGFEIQTAGHGKEALEVLQKVGAVDLAMVDWNMPEMNGYEFVVAARQIPAYASMQIVMVTTETEMAQVVKAIQAGANEYIMKPFTKEVIQEKLALLGIEERRAA